MLLLDSIYINNSGGKVLLDILVKELHQSGIDTYYLLDERCKGSYPSLPSDKVTYLKASLRSRHSFYKKNNSRFSKVFCFANIPPTVKLNIPVYTYFHNLLHIEQPPDYPFKAKILKKLKGALMKFLKKNTSMFVVQSANVKNSLCNYLSIDPEQCLVMPFYRELSCDIPFHLKKPEFVYVSNGNSHKNHLRLLEAWSILSSKNIRVPLHLTITKEYNSLLLLIEAYQQKGIPIINHSFADVKELYSISKYSVYPSLIESFGLGLIEAIDCGTEIIAADLPYVHAVVKPAMTFDPLDPQAIAATVEQILANDAQNLQSAKLVRNQIEELINLLK